MTKDGVQWLLVNREARYAAAAEESVLVIVAGGDVSFGCAEGHHQG